MTKLSQWLDGWRYRVDNGQTLWCKSTSPGVKIGLIPKAPHTIVYNNDGSIKERLYG